MNPTHTLNIKEDSGNPDKPTWRRIGAIFPNKSGNGGRIKWDEGTTSVPVDGDLFTFPFVAKDDKTEPAPADSTEPGNDKPFEVG